MSVTLAEILDMVGRLDDAPGDDTPRERFRRRLREKVGEVGQVRDYIEECLRTPSEQHNRALQDLVNHLGHLLGFEVMFGRYQGVRGQVGFDGHWTSPTGFHIVAEVKTTDTYSIKAATLVGYVDELISQKVIPSWELALGLYALGRADTASGQIENAIIAERRTHQLRLISTESLLSLAELAVTYDVAHEDVLAVLRPSGPAVDPVVDLMARLVAQRQTEDEATDQLTAVAATQLAPSRSEVGLAVVSALKETQTDVQPPVIRPPTTAVTPAYWLTPVKSDEVDSAQATVRTLVADSHVYAFGDKTPGRKRLKSGDWICFYATSIGVIAHAKVNSSPEHRPHPRVRDADRYPWVFGVSDEVLYLDEPMVLDANLRAQLEVFQGKDPNKAWSWFVQATHQMTEHDFLILTRQPGVPLSPAG